MAVWTLLYAMAVAMAFTVLGFALHAQGEGAWRNWAGWLAWYGRNLVVSVAITLCIQALLLLARQALGAQRVRSLRPWQRSVFFTSVSLLGVALGLLLGGWLLGGHDVGFAVSLDANSLAATLLLGGLISVVFWLIWSARSAEIAARMQATEARLQLMQAQIEPHFLFNTLANVLSLIDHDPPAARQMLETFIDHLRGSLAQMRNEHSTVDSELALARTYLALMAQRMGDRLQFDVQAGPGTGAAALPPLLLQPLVENAIRHGLEPALDGGRVQVRAERVGPQLRLTVRDTGVGLHAPRRPGPAGAGIALANIRERLATRYGPTATLSLEAAEPGTLATLALPWPTA